MSFSFAEHCSGLFYRLPTPLVRRLYPAWHFTSSLYRSMAQRRAEQRLPCREMQCNGLKVLFVGEGAAAPYWRRLLFNEVKDPPPFFTHWEGAALIEKLIAARTEYDLVVTALQRDTRPELHQLGFCIPSFIHQSAEIPATVEEFDAALHANRETAKDLNKIRRNGFAYRVSRDACDLRRFYETCHRPYILMRHGDMAHVDSFNEFSRYFKNGGELLIIELGGKMVSGSLFQQHGREMRALLSGLLDADIELLQAGALVAEYYYLTVEAIARGCTVHAMGRARPFLKDGVLRFKRKWGSVVGLAENEPLEFSLVVGRYSPAVMHVLHENPFIRRIPAAENGANGAALADCIFLSEEPEIPLKELTGRLRLMHQPGTQIMQLFPLTSAWQQRLADAAPIRERVPCPVQVLIPPLEANGVINWAVSPLHWLST